jgi:hypothetical protein
MINLKIASVISVVVTSSVIIIRYIIISRVVTPPSLPHQSPRVYPYNFIGQILKIFECLGLKSNVAGNFFDKFTKILLIYKLARHDDITEVSIRTTTGAVRCKCDEMWV